MQKNRKKSAKKFGGSGKSSTFAIPFGKRGTARGAGRGTGGDPGRTEFIDKTDREASKASTETRRIESVSPRAGRPERTERQEALEK